MSKEALFVFDHDGTLTDPMIVHEAFTEIYERVFSEKSGIPKKVIHGVMKEQREEIKSHPKMYEWVKERGLKIAPATVDTYVLNSVAAEMGIRVLKSEGKKNLPVDNEAIKAFLQEIYYASYPQTKLAYRDDAARMIKELHPLGRLIIVSNSDPSHILAKIKPFLKRNKISEDAIEVVGNAQKFIITPEWERVSRITHFKGLARPIFLRRGHYGGVILSLGQDPTLVVGDSGEMDLATPEALGFKTLLLQTPFSVSWELNHFENVDSLDGVTGKIMRDLGH